MQFYCHKMCVGVGGLEFRKKCLYNTTLFPSSLVPRQSHPGIRALLVWHCICQQKTFIRALQVILPIANA